MSGINHIKSIDKKKWDICISSSPNAAIYAYSWYLDIVSPGWEALIWDDYNAVFPLTCKKKFGIRYLIKPYFTQKHALYGEHINPDMLKSAINNLKKTYRYSDIRISTINNYTIPGLLTADNINYELDLNKKYEDLFQKYSPNNKKNIKSSRNKGLSIKEGLSADEFIHFTKHNLSQKIEKIPEIHWAMLKQLIEATNKNAMYKIIGVYKGADLCASAFLPFINGKWYLLVNSSTETGRKNRALYFLLDYFINNHAEKEQILDFEGSNISSIAYFFSGFGAKKVPYCTLKYNNLPVILKLFKR